MKSLRILFHALGASFSLALSAALAILLCAILALGLWVQSDGSLAATLALATRFLSAGQTLQVQGVSGSLQSGGQIQSLTWKDAGLVVEMQDLTLQWDWRALLDRELRIRSLHLRVLRVEDRRVPSTTPLTELVLPLAVDMPFSVDQVEWLGPPAVSLQAVQGHYRFDGKTHTLERGSLQMAAATYSLQAQLQAQGPGALALHAAGVVQAPLPHARQTVRLQAQADIQGTLYGRDAVLDLLLDLQPQAGSATGALAATQAHVEARLLPAADQPVQRANAQWKQLDLASIWPQAPQTSLSGVARVVPDGAAWKAELAVQNKLEGSLVQNRLPLQSASANVAYRNGQWQLLHLQADVAGGSLQAQGSYAGSPAQWAATGSLQHLDLARLDPRWTGPRLDGHFSATQATSGIAFDATLSGRLQGSAEGPVSLQTRGLWSAPLLQLDKVVLQSPKVQLAGQLQVDISSLATRGELEASLPGASARVAGHMGRAAGQGHTEWQVTDAAALLAWLQQLPVVGARAAGLQAQGVANLKANWQGGWHDLGRDLQLDASLESRQWVLSNAYQFADLRLQATGGLQALALQLQGQLKTGQAQIALQSQTQLAQTGAGQWHAKVNQLQAQLMDGLQPVPWKLALDRALELDWQGSALARSLAATAGSMRLNGPAPGAATLQWQPMHWSQVGATGDPAIRSGWTTRGNVQGVPLAWLEALGQTRIANLGLRGDLVFGGQWDASGGNRMQLHARLQRSSGDLQLLSADGASALPAGLRDAHVEIQIEQQAVRAQLVWDSDAAGAAQADFATQLAADGSARWPQDAPVRGSVQANLPRAGAWSLFAPVGWRIHGTLEASAALSGTRSAPAWNGSLAARDLAVRSVVDGIDLSNGVMRLQLDGQHMDIAEFTLRGAGGAGGGQITANGSVEWLPMASGSSFASRLRMAVDARAQAFRVTSRPDQRLVVSGNVNVRLAEAKLVVRGALVADQALIVLPEDSTPTLGADVTVRRKRLAPAPVALPVDDPASHLLQTVVPDLQVTLDPGNNFQLQGHGLTTRLVGLLSLQTQGNSLEPRLSGELRTVNGAYKAYGQRLRIEEGKLLFNGPFDNPALDIRAVRPNLQQVVGVQVNGTAQLPVVRLYSDPDMAEVEKLSWLVLGRSSANGGAQTALLQQAALALLAGNGKAAPTEQLFNALGLDEVSLGQTAVTNLDGSAGSEASVKIGKRLSRDFYVAFERSLAGTLGTLYVFYDLSKRFTLRGESGSTNAIDLIFTTRYD